MNLCKCGCGTPTTREYARGHHWKVQAKNVATPPNPSGLCQCGCGAITPIARVTVHARGVVKGEHIRYIVGHGNVKHRLMSPPNPSGLCMCGCGQKTRISNCSDPRDGLVIGHYRRFIHNHHQTCEEPETGYKIEDRGFETPCWVWQREKDKRGYGRFQFKKKVILAHRYFYSKYVGKIGPDLEVHHRCHVTSCVNPEHLQAVTSLVNNRAKKMMRLSIEKARVVRQLREWGGSLGSIAKLFFVNKTTISAICENRIWKEGAE